jgi:hypothetical protein
MSQRPQPVSKRPATKGTASKHRRPTTTGRHRRITAEMERRAEANKRRAMLVKCVASVGAVAALSGGVSTAATSTLASSGQGGGPESAAAKQNLHTRTPSRVSATGPASRSTTRTTLTGISGGVVGGVGPSTPDLVDPAASPVGDGQLPDAISPIHVETAGLASAVTAPIVSPKSKSATSVPKVTKVTVKPATVVAKAVAKAAPAATTTKTTTKTTTTSGTTSKTGSGTTTGSGSTTSGSGGTTSGSGSGSGSGGGPVAPVSPPIVLSGNQPGPGNTGVPAGTALTVMNGDLTITTAGATYSGLDIHGSVKVEAPNVTIKDSIIRGGPNATGALVYDLSNNATNFLIEDSEVVPAYPSVYLDGIDGWNYTALRDNIHGSVDGLKMFGPNATVQDSWIHGLVTYAHDPAQGGGLSHNDGVQILSGSNLKIIGNTIEGGSNTAVMITQDHGTTNNVVIDSNWISGGTCSINMTPKPLGALNAITVDNNIFTNNSTKSCPILSTTQTNLTVSGNVYAGTGLPVPVNNKGAN